MSGEAFETVMSCDMRTSPDGRSAEYAPSMSQQPRWLSADGTINRDEDEPTWAACMLYAEDAVRLSARAIREQEMDGLTGDHPEKREQVAALLERCAELVRVLALDHACDGEVTDERWRTAMTRLCEETGV
jgi:hypothetical protein